MAISSKKTLLSGFVLMMAIILIFASGCSNQNTKASKVSSNKDTQQMAKSSKKEKSVKETSKKEPEVSQPVVEKATQEESKVEPTETSKENEAKPAVQNVEPAAPPTTVLDKPVTKYVNVSTLNVRSGAGTNFSVITVVAQGQAVSVSELSGEWSKVQVNDKTGWVSGKYLTDTKPEVVVNTPAPAPSGNVADQLKTVGGNRQLILVTTNGYSTSSATIRTFEKDANGKWNQLLNIPGYVGKLGITYNMSEGGKKSPIGKFTIGTAFGRNGNPGTKLPFRAITDDDVWVDDPESPLYNTWQSRSATQGQWKSAENMNIPAYTYGFVINYNTARTPYKGSAIFFHISSGYTLGCTGTSQANVISILKWLDPAKNPVIIQAPVSELSKF